MLEREMAKIYGLIDPRSNQIRYVGCTIQRVEDRLTQHIVTARKSDTGRSRWLNELDRLGLRPKIVILEQVEPKRGHEREKHWTSKLIDEGANLTNEGVAMGGGLNARRKIEWTPKLDALLGVIGDSRIAEQLGVSRKSVTYRRNKLGIPAANDRSRNSRPPNMAGHNKVDLPQGIIDQLGTMSDASLAEIAGVSKKRIMVARHKRGIPSYAAQSDHPTRYKTGNYPERWKV